MIFENVQTLINYGIRNGLISAEDEYVVRNSLIDILGLGEWNEAKGEVDSDDIDAVLAPIIDYAAEKGIISDTANSRDLFDTKLMGVFTPMPREVNAEFKARAAQSPESATEWYFDFSKKLNYVRAGRIAKDLKWTYDCEFGTLDITINCSKPEKDPRDIAAAKLAKSASYPKCQLCAENAGFAGTVSHPARQNLRPVNVTVNGQPWQLQYSPYGYYNEHCIVFNTEHIPMVIDESVFGKLFDIIDYLPHYFVGSNADLPIVGGSILSHEHFQGGKYTFAMETSPVETEFKLDNYPEVNAGIVKWPMSVIRLSSKNRDQLSKCCNHVLVNWRSYSDPDATIFAETDGTPHNTVTPIARKKGDFYECDLVLRNNYTTEERPMGLYHPNPTLHHIKKENIGLIEVMGLAVLPARLSKELVTLEKALVNGEELNTYPELVQHADWAKEVLARHPEFCADNAKHIIEQEVGEVFRQVLLDAGVYKRDEAGKNAFMRFVNSLN
ncbi:MAG: UDP-glucose--hexose-1-phosphate uridylyltransferase [Ruminococcaceae bacterium]|nr:UDP-glucose--hexose-1-phosphate uridylyltransferase [Oscillospiraceae bacterium]